MPSSAILFLWIVLWGSAVESLLQPPTPIEPRKPVLAVDSIANPAAAAQKSQPRSSQRRRLRHRGQQQLAPDRIREIQQALIREGYLSGEPTGKWDAATTSAMRRFQKAHGYPETGKPDSLSLHQLGLGAETAGQSAPRAAPANSQLAPKN